VHFDALQGGDIHASGKAERHLREPLRQAKGTQMIRHGANIAHGRCSIVVVIGKRRLPKYANA
jgi:hypothetical protein